MTPSNSNDACLHPNSGSVDLAELVAYLDSLLDVASGSDFAPNGLQVEGRKEISKLVTGVSACLELFERAAAADCRDLPTSLRRPRDHKSRDSALLITGRRSA